MSSQRHAYSTHPGYNDEISVSNKRELVGGAKESLSLTALGSRWANARCFFITFQDPETILHSMEYFSLALDPPCELSFLFQLSHFPSLSFSEAFFGVQWPISSALSLSPRQ